MGCGQGRPHPTSQEGPGTRGAPQEHMRAWPSVWPAGGVPGLCVKPSPQEPARTEGQTHSSRAGARLAQACRPRRLQVGPPGVCPPRALWLHHPFTLPFPAGICNPSPLSKKGSQSHLLTNVIGSSAFPRKATRCRLGLDPLCGWRCSPSPAREAGLAVGSRHTESQPSGHVATGSTRRHQSP